jgi:hypothetical protein
MPAHAVYCVPNRQLPLGAILRQWSLLAFVKDYDKAIGFESLAYVPAMSGVPGYFYAGLQSDGTLYVVRMRARRAIARSDV